VELDQHIAAVSGWLIAVHVESAEQRVGEMRERYRSNRAAPPQASDAEMARCAIHESGHAVIATRVGLVVNHACIHPNATGSVEYEAATESLDAMLSLAITDLAGIFSELRVGINSSRQVQLAHGSDLLLARLRVDQADVRGWTAAVAASMAFCSVASNWPAIIRVAAALRALGELDGEEISALARRAQ
jgi:hypothetical protein